MLVFLKKWGMIDTLATFWPVFAASVRMIGPPSFTKSLKNCVCTISFTPLQIGGIGRVTWTCSFVRTAAVLACFMLSIMSKRLCYLLSNVAIFTSVAQCGGLHTSAIGCYQFHGLWFSYTIHVSSWKKRLTRLVSGIWQLWNIGFILYVFLRCSA